MTGKEFLAAVTNSEVDSKKAVKRSLFTFGWVVTTGPNIGIDVIAPRRQDMNPVLRSAHIICGTPHPFPPKTPRDSVEVI